MGWRSVREQVTAPQLLQPAGRVPWFLRLPALHAANDAGAVCEVQVQQKANLSPRLTTSEDTWSQLQTARREHQRTKHTIEALSDSRGATACRSCCAAACCYTHSLYGQQQLPGPNTAVHWSRALCCRGLSFSVVVQYCLKRPDTEAPVQRTESGRF